MRRLLMATLFLLSARLATAQVRVSPTGVSVSSMTATTVYLTYGGLRDQVATEALWCGELQPAPSPARGSLCNPGTIFGRLPLRYDLSRTTGAFFTDIMSIPASVARVAYQEAVRGATSTFFYVRRFVSLSGGPDEYVAVTCRLTGGGARSPFSLTDMRIAFETKHDLPFVTTGTTPPGFSAHILYTGTGRLTGRWEVALPGEEPPTTQDLLPEASLPPDIRGTQRRYAQLERFDVFLPPNGEITLPGPDPRLLPTAVAGTYRILLRLEATNDRETDSDLTGAGAGAGIVHSGGVAGFALPQLLYIVAGDDSPTLQGNPAMRLVLPPDSAQVRSDSGFTVAWGASEHADFYQVEFRGEQDRVLLQALLPRTSRYYRVAGGSLGPASAIRWRVTALGSGGDIRGVSDWRVLQTNDTIPGVTRPPEGKPPR